LGDTPVIHGVPVDVAGVSTYKAVTDCADTGGNHLNYTQSTDTFSCGTSSSSGGGTVTSVAMTVPTGFTIGGSPITAAGTLAVGLSTEPANTVWSGPTTGAAAAPTFRALVSADLPVATSSLPGAAKPDNQTTVVAATGAISTTAANTTFAINHTVATTDMGGQFNMNGTSLTVTFPAIAGCPGSALLCAGQSVRVNNQAPTPVLIATTPTINNYPFIGASAGCATASTCYIPAMGGIDCVSNGVSLDCVPIGEAAIKRVDLSWGPGQNLSTDAIPFRSWGTNGHIILAIRCNPEVVAGAAATIDVWMAASGTALGSGTKLTSTACNANTGAFTDQTGLLGATSIVPANTRLGIVATGWTSTLGSGVITVSYQ
jgi:hypothetical protein